MGESVGAKPFIKHLETLRIDGLKTFNRSLGVSGLPSDVVTECLDYNLDKMIKRVSTYEDSGLSLELEVPAGKDWFGPWFDKNREIVVTAMREIYGIKLLNTQYDKLRENFERTNNPKNLREFLMQVIECEYNEGAKKQSRMFNDIKEGMQKKALIGEILKLPQFSGLGLVEICLMRM